MNVIFPIVSDVSRGSGVSPVLLMVAIVPHIVCKKVTVIFSFSDEKQVVMSGGHLILN